MSTTNPSQDELEFIKFGFIISACINIILVYVFGYAFFKEIGLGALGILKFLSAIFSRRMYGAELFLKIIAVLCMCAYLIFYKPKKKPDINRNKQIFLPGIVGFVLYFFALPIAAIGATEFLFATIYIVCIFLGFYLLGKGVSNTSHLFGVHKIDQFDTENKKFPMEQRWIITDTSVNVLCENSKVNIVAPFNGVLSLGLPNSGKSFVWIMEGILQHMKKGFPAVIYDFKEGSLSKFAFNILQVHKDEILKQRPNIKFMVFNPENPKKSVRINAISPKLLNDQDACVDAGTSFFNNMNLQSIKKQGDFFVESGRAYIILLILFLRFSSLSSKKNKDGEATVGNCCTLAHVVALSTMEIDLLFRILAHKKETKVIFGQFKDAYDKGAYRQLVGQIASGKQPLSYFASPKLFWVLSGDECSLDINDPENPKYLMLQGAGAPKRDVYSPILGLIINQILKAVNRKGRLPVHVSIDELYTLYVKDLATAVGTGRENGVSIWIGVQSIEMLVEAYGKDLANVVIDNFGTVITGKARVETAKMFETLFGKSMHKRISTQYNRLDNPQSISEQSEFLLQAGDIVKFDSNEMAGILAEERKGQLPIKIFRDTPVIDVKQREKYKRFDLPDYVNMDDKNFEKLMEQNFEKIFEEVKNLLIEEHNKLYMPA
jgi:hypothetical protein